MLWKTDLRASEPECNSKPELGRKRNNSFIAVRGEGGGSRPWPSKICKRKGLGHFIGKYRIWLVSAGIVDELPAASSVMGPFQGCTQFLKCLSKKGGGRFAEERKKGTLKLSFAEA